jgi:hypothetical protein
LHEALFLITSVDRKQGRDMSLYGNCIGEALPDTLLVDVILCSDRLADLTRAVFWLERGGDDES